MLSDRHPIKHLHIKAGDVKDFKGRRLISGDRCDPETVLSLPIQVTEDTETILDVLKNHRQKQLREIKEYTRHGLTGRTNSIISQLKQELIIQNRLPNTGGNIRVVRILLEVKVFQLTIVGADAGYLWAQMESTDRHQCIKEPYMRPAEQKCAVSALQEALIKRRSKQSMEERVDVTDTKYEACIKTVHENTGVPKGYLPQIDAHDFLLHMMQHFQIAVLHPWQTDLLKKFEASMNRYEALNFPFGERRYMGKINREADVNIGGKNNNGMKATYQIHDESIHFGDSGPGGPVDAIVSIDLAQSELRAVQKLTLIGDPMKNIESRVVIQGHDAANLDDDQILDVINDLEAQIKRYEEMPTATKVVAKRIKGLKKDLKKLVEYIDRNENDDSE